MSYCRFGGDSDVYVYESTEGFECCGCKLTDEHVSFETPAEMIVHLKEHIASGQLVPQYALDMLAEDVAMAAAKDGG